MLACRVACGLKKYTKAVVVEVVFVVDVVLVFVLVVNVLVVVVLVVVDYIIYREREIDRERYR